MKRLDFGDAFNFLLVSVDDSQCTVAKSDSELVGFNSTEINIQIERYIFPEI